MGKAKFAAIVLALFLLFGGVFVAGANAESKDDKTGKVKKIAKKIEKDLKDTGRYLEEDLEELVRLLEELAKVKLNNEEKKIAKSYIIAEIKG